MKLGLGLYRHMLTPDNFRFAKQAGATHIVAHLTDYFGSDDELSTGSGSDDWGVVDTSQPYWTYEEMRDLRAAINAEGLELAALENLSPGHWYDVLLDGPRRDEQMGNLKTMIRSMGKAGIPCIGYNFSIAGVWGRSTGPWGRGGAETAGFEAPAETSIPNGSVWNMVYDPNAPAGTIGTVTHEQLWDRVTRFLQELVPVAEEAGVRLAAHPDDPPLPTLRDTARLVYQPRFYQQLLDIVPSHHNGLEFCLGSLSEMTECVGDQDIYSVVDQYSQQNAICYIHFRNVKGKVPTYYEVFVDEGDIDMVRVLRILHKNNYDGVLIPDHTPQMTCDAPWYAGMAYAMGYMKAAMKIIQEEG
ncbi:MAG: mannonate dehydratase [Chloroflexota bacterium]